MPENQRKNRKSRGRTRARGRYAPTEQQPDIVQYEQRLRNEADTETDELPNPAWVDDRTGRPGPPEAPGRKPRYPQKRG